MSQGFSPFELLALDDEQNDDLDGITNQQDTVRPNVSMGLAMQNRLPISTFDSKCSLKGHCQRMLQDSCIMLCHVLKVRVCTVND